MKVKKYRKLPVEIEALEFVYDTEGISALFNFCGDYIGVMSKIRTPTAKAEVEIVTIEDRFHSKVQHIATEGDYIIKGEEGEFYPCKPEIFKKTYEEVLTEKGETNE